MHLFHLSVFKIYLPDEKWGTDIGKAETNEVHGKFSGSINVKYKTKIAKHAGKSTSTGTCSVLSVGMEIGW